MVTRKQRYPSWLLVSLIKGFKVGLRMRVKNDFIEVGGGETTGEANSHPSSAWGAGRGSQVFRVGVEGREIVGKSRA